MIWRRVMVLGSILSVALITVGCSHQGAGKGDDPTAKKTTESNPDGDRPSGTGKTSGSSPRLEGLFRVV